MPQPNTSYVDGYVTPERQVTVIPDVEFPFENYPTPDTYARILSRRYDVTPKFFTPKIGVRTAWTNYLLYSATFADASWTKTNITNTDNSLANPNDGTVTMASGLETVTNAEHAYQQAYTFTATAHTLSWIVTPNGRTNFRLKANDGTTNFTAFFNLTGSGLVGTVANCTAVVSLVAPGTYRISITFTPLASAGNIYLNYSTDGSTVSYVGDITLGAYVWGAQIVRASLPGPVIITTTPARAVSSPNLDDSDVFAYLAQEDSPKNYNSAIAAIGRKFFRIPASQTSFPGSQYFSLPQVSNDFDGLSSLTTFNYPINGNIGNGFYNAAAAAIYTNSGQALYGPTKSVSAVKIGYATSGTFTLTFGASTTGSLNYNDNGGTIAAAINGLASIISAGLTATVSGLLTTTTGGQLTITWTAGATLSLLTLNGGSLVGTTATHPTTQLITSANQVIRLSDELTITGHGFNTGVALAGVRNTDSILIMAVSNWGSVDANTVWVPTVGGIGNFVFAGSFNRAYPTGQSYLLRTKEVEDFYLPGVSTGITTPADITVPTGLQNPAAFISAIMTLSGFQIYKSEGPAPWMGSLIYGVKKVYINFSDF